MIYSLLWGNAGFISSTVVSYVFFVIMVQVEYGRAMSDLFDALPVSFTAQDPRGWSLKHGHRKLGQGAGSFPLFFGFRV